MKRDCGKWGLLLREHGYKSTVARELIPDILESTDEHLSSEEVYQQVVKTNPNDNEAIEKITWYLAAGLALMAFAANVSPSVLGNKDEQSKFPK